MEKDDHAREWVRRRREKEWRAGIVEGGREREKMQLLVTEFLFVSLSKSSVMDAISSLFPLVSLSVSVWSSPNCSASEPVSLSPSRFSFCFPSCSPAVPSRN